MKISCRLMQMICAGSSVLCDKKQILTPAEVLSAHRQLAAEFGNQADRVVADARARTMEQRQPANSALRAQEAVTFSRDKHFEREAVVDERLLMRDALRRGMGKTTYEQVRQNFENRVLKGEFLATQPGDANRWKAIHNAGNCFC